MKDSEPHISFFSRLLDFVAPRLCPVCGRRLSVTEETLCASCNLHLPRTGFTTSPEDNEMARLFWGKLTTADSWYCPVEQAAALFRFEPSSPSSHLIYDLKYHFHPEYGEMLGKMVAKELPDSFFKDVFTIIPVPLSRKRKAQRGYNQSEMIARGISEVTGIGISTDIIVRKTFQESQTKKQWHERMENVENAFQLKKGERIAGRRILVVDDVLTTGATIMACCRELLKAGHVSIHVLTICFTKN